MNTFFSIIIPAFNASTTITRAIKSVIDQPFTDREIIVIDDGSTDSTAHIVLNYSEFGVKYFHQENRGVCAARNKGAEVAAGIYLVFLDADDWLNDNCLSSYYKSLSGNSTKMVLGLIKYLSKEDKMTNEIKPGKSNVDYAHGLPGSFAINAETFREMGGYDEELRYSENSDLFLRMRLEKWVAPEEVVLNFEAGVEKFVEPEASRMARYTVKKYQSVKYFLDKHRIFFENNPKQYLNFRRILAMCALQNDQFIEAQKCMREILFKNPLRMKSYFHFLLFLFPKVAKLYYRLRG